MTRVNLAVAVCLISLATSSHVFITHSPPADAVASRQDINLYALPRPSAVTQAPFNVGNVEDLWIAVTGDDSAPIKEPMWEEIMIQPEYEVFLVGWHAPDDECHSAVMLMMVDMLSPIHVDLPAAGFRPHGLSSQLPFYALVSAPAGSEIELDSKLLWCHIQNLQFTPASVRTHLDDADYSQLLPSETKKQILAKLTDTEDIYYKWLSELSGEISFSVPGCSECSIKTRHSTTSDLNEKATILLEHRFKEAGLEVSRQPFTVSGQPTHNIIGIKKGTTKQDEIVVIGAHMDSTSPQPSTDAPGAVDNGSGTISVALIAEFLKDYQFERTIYFIAFSGEEQGLIGSTYFVRTASDNLNIVSALVFDMTAYSNRYFGVTVEGTTNSEIQKLMKLCEANINEFAPQLKDNRLSDRSFGSDHVPFQRAGIPCILMIERDDTNYPGYHRTTDRMNYVNSGQAVGIMVGQAGALIDLAGLVE